MAFWGISARNPEQKRAMQALLSDKPFIFLTGRAGTGKTLVAQAVGLHEVVERKQYRKLVYTRLQVQLGGDQGALPGTIDEKTYPFVRPFMDNLELMAGKDALEYLIAGVSNKRKVFFDPIQTMRGGSFHQSFIMVDEAQNLDVATIAAIGTRLADGSKMVFLGNHSQIDNPKLRVPEKNGLFRLLDGLYKGGHNEVFEHVNLNTVERHKSIDVFEQILRNHEMDKRFVELEARGNTE